MTASLVQGALFGAMSEEGNAGTAVTLKSIASRHGTEYSPAWLSPVCTVTPRRWRNHTGCDYALCTCGCHKGAATAGEETP